jgi:polysaccharide pyruvyl transferase WcaK-like protein
MGGGGIIQDESSVINLLYYYLQSWVANALYRKPVFLIYVGVGPVTSRLGHWLLRRMAARVAGSLVRDQESADLLRTHGFDPANTVLAFDIVYNLDVTDEPALPQTDNILFAPRDWFFTKRFLPTRFALVRAKKNGASGLNRYREQLSRLIDGVLDAHPGTTVIGIPFFLSQDNDLLSWISAQLGAEQRARFVIHSEYISPEEYVRIARGSRAILGMRLHSLILGTLSGKPLVPLIYSSKVRSMIAYLGLADSATELASPDFDFEGTLAKLERALSTGNAIDNAALATIIRTNDEKTVEFFGRIRARLAGERA